MIDQEIKPILYHLITKFLEDPKTLKEFVKLVGKDNAEKAERILFYNIACYRSQFPHYQKILASMNRDVPTLIRELYPEELDKESKRSKDTYMSNGVEKKKRKKKTIEEKQTSQASKKTKPELGWK